MVKKLDHPQSGITGITWHSKTQTWLVRYLSLWIGSDRELSGAVAKMDKYLDGKPLSNHPNRKTSEVKQSEKAEKARIKYFKQRETVKNNNYSVKLPEVGEYITYADDYKPENLEPLTYRNYIQPDEKFVRKPYLEPMTRWSWMDAELPEEQLEPDKGGTVMIGLMPFRCQLCRKNQECPNGYKDTTCQDYEDY